LSPVREATPKEVRAAFRAVFWPDATKENEGQRLAASVVVKQLRHEAGAEIKTYGAKAAGWYENDRLACFAAGKLALYHRMLWWAGLTDAECEQMAMKETSYLELEEIPD